MSIKKAAYYGAHRLIGSSLGQVYEAYLKEDSTELPLDTVERSLTKLLTHCEQNVPYYSAIMREIDDAYRQEPELYLQRLPVLTKELIRRNFSQLASRDLSRRKWAYNTSGGSTGEPIKLIQDRAYTDRQMAVLALSF
jgi:phenylacetate-CoA ligase